jgi:hypothetical protein
MVNINLKPVALGILLSLCALLAGEMHGMAFGAKEDAIMDHFKATAEANSAALGSPEKAQKAVEGSWEYLKMAHFHFMGLGVVGMALCMFVLLSPAKDVHKTIVTTAVGFGAFVYPLFWTLTAFKTSSVGAHAAKESLEALAQAGAGAGFLGLLGVIAVAVSWSVARRHA